jgi:hypothetical protein
MRWLLGIVLLTLLGACSDGSRPVMEGSPGTNPEACPKSFNPMLAGQPCDLDPSLACTYLLEDCQDYSDVMGSCQCRRGLWECGRGYDCPGHGRQDGGAPKPDRRSEPEG